MTTDWDKELQDATDRVLEDVKSVIRKTGPKSKPSEERLAQIEFFKNKSGRG